MIDFCIHNSRVETIDQSDVVNGRSTQPIYWTLFLVFKLVVFCHFFPQSVLITQRVFIVNIVLLPAPL